MGRFQMISWGDPAIKAFRYLCEIFGNIADNSDKATLVDMFQAYQEYRLTHGYEPPQEARKKFWEEFQKRSPIKLPDGYIENNLLRSSPEIDRICMGLIISRLIKRYGRIVKATKSYK